MFIGIAISLLIMTGLMIGATTYMHIKGKDVEVVLKSYLIDTAVVVVFGGSLGWLIEHFFS